MGDDANGKEKSEYEQKLANQWKSFGWFILIVLVGTALIILIFVILRILSDSVEDLETNACFTDFGGSGCNQETFAEFCSEDNTNKDFELCSTRCHKYYEAGSNNACIHKDTCKDLGVKLSFCT
jgi:hypothetical protein